MILIISSEQDEHARAVLNHLASQRFQVRLLNLSQFPKEMQLSISYNGPHNHAALSSAENNLDLLACKVIWWRRPQPFDLHPEITDAVYRSFAYNECYSAIYGLWLTLDAFWVNQPMRDEEASRKVSQLKIAREVGLETPSTLVTNDPHRARAFINTYGPEKTVYKAFSGTQEAWRETRVLHSDEVDLIDNIRFAPVIFQEYVPARCDLRVTVVGQDIFPAAIYSGGTSYEFDYRMDMDNARVESFDLPERVVECLHAYMDRLGLIYGAIDMRLTPDGRFVFLEINPSGQWLFIENRTGQSITETFATLLATHDK